ncbi:general transcription factor 3C polypeptide 4-like [Lineus longissimus]|uniref:general transcription factor 3C polypeptide 4-like n=1 Tax=Lineus longissimus TaxID=88925 RepID=UPI002B4F04BE
MNSQVDVPSFGFVKISWSPLGADVQNQCILATLSLDHRLHLCHNRGKGRELQKAVDISKLYHEYHKGKNFSALKRGIRGVDKPGVYELMLYQLAAVDMCWSHVFSTTDGDEIRRMLVLFMMTKGGDVVSWRIQVPVVMGEEPQLLGIKSTNMKLPSTCHWCQTEEEKGFLCVGFNDGRVKAMMCIFDGVSGDISLKEEFVLWEHTDRLACTDMLWKKQESALFVVKESFLLKFDLDLTDGLKVTSTPTPVIQHAMQIVGMCHAEGTTTITASEDRMVNMYLHEHGQSGVVRLPHEPKPLRCHGATLSRNGHLLGVLQSPNYTYNRLKEKTALKLIFTSLHSRDEIADILLRGNKQNLTSYSDLIEDLRRQVFSGQTLPMRLQLLLTDKDLWQTLNSFQKKLIRFLMIVLICSTPADDKNMARMEDLKSDLSVIETMLLCDHIKKSLKQFEKEAKSKKTERDKAVALTMQNWLQRYESGPAHGSPTIEDSLTVNCPICDEDLKDIASMAAECRSGHQFPRCCVTLLPCEDLRYRKCYYCDSYALPIVKDSSWAGELLSMSNCTLCDGILL